MHRPARRPGPAPRRSRSATLGIALVAVLVTAAAALAGCGSGDEPTTLRATIRGDQAQASRLDGTWPTTTTTTTTTAPVTLDPATGLTVSGPMGPPWPDFFVAAWATGSVVPLFQSPGVPVPTGRSLTNPTHENVPLVMLVRRTQGDWLQVQVSTRPNGATAWIRKADVRLEVVPNHVLIELGAKRLTVFHGDDVVFQTSVAPGKASSPTPVGSFYVDVLAKPRDPNGPYGIYQVSFSGFSTVYSSFGGGNGQVAMHGTNRPELIGQPASHGCVRLTNDDITTVLHLAPQGTPVDVVA